MTLNWRNDPLLIDTEPTPKNEWLTANKLIEQKKQEKIFLEQGKLNLYSIMIRKHDFLAGERLIQRLPYISLTVDLASKLRKRSLTLAERSHHYFQDTAIDYSIKKWQQKIIDYTENQKRLPFPLFRLSDHWQEFLTQDYVPFQSARGEHFHMPTRISRDLAYFLGSVIGDGHLNYHNVVIVDFSKEHMEMMQTLAKTLFGFEGPVTGEKKVWLLHLNNKWLVRLVNFLTDQPITGKKYHALREPLIFVSDEDLRWEFWSGALDADGSYKDNVSFSSSSKFFAYEFARVLDVNKIKYSLTEREVDLGTGYTVNIKAISKDILSNVLHPRHPIKKIDFNEYLTRQRYNLVNHSTDFLIYDFNPKMILSLQGENYFNFSLLTTLHVVGCTIFLRNVRNNFSWTQQDLAEYLGISKGKLASYEYSDSLPIPLLEKLLLMISSTPINLMPFLHKYKLDLFHSRKTQARLDLQPNEKLLSLVRNLSLRNRYLLILSTSENKEILYKNISDYFGIKVTNNKILNSVLKLYLKTFFQTKN